MVAAVCTRGGRSRCDTQSPSCMPGLSMSCGLLAAQPAAQHPHVSWRCKRDSSTSGVRWRRKKALCRCARNTNRGAHARKASSHMMSRAEGRAWSPLPAWPHTCARRESSGGSAGAAWTVRLVRHRGRDGDPHTFACCSVAEHTAAQKPCLAALAAGQRQPGGRWRWRWVLGSWRRRAAGDWRCGRRRPLHPTRRVNQGRHCGGLRAHRTGHQAREDQRLQAEGRVQPGLVLREFQLPLCLLPGIVEGQEGPHKAGMAPGQIGIHPE